MLPSLEILRDKLKERFTHSEFDLSELQLREPGVSPKAVRDAEVALRLSFPTQFTQLAQIFDFSQLNLANLYFHYGFNLKALVECNLGFPFPWWGKGARPSNLLYVAGTDGHNVLLNLPDGTISTTDHDSGINRMVARNFEEMIQLAASIALGHSQDEKVAIAIANSSSPFWEQLARGTA